jgi:hypothetical protein
VLLTDSAVDSTTGNLVTATGTVQGTINYTTGAVSVTPHMTDTRYSLGYSTILYTTA